MKQKLGFFASRWGIIAVGALIGIIAVSLQKLGNPANMGICMACFLRDVAGALGLHRAAMVQYRVPRSRRSSSGHLSPRSRSGSSGSAPAPLPSFGLPLGCLP